MKTEAPERIETDKSRVQCSGSGGPLGHPNVWLEMGEGSEVQCPYCSRIFVRKTDDADS